MIEIIHCPTERMIAYYFAKPLKESLLRKMRDIIMGIDPFPMEEHVGEKEINATGNEPSVNHPSGDVDNRNEPWVN